MPGRLHPEKCSTCKNGVYSMICDSSADLQLKLASMQFWHPTCQATTPPRFGEAPRATARPLWSLWNSSRHGLAAVPCCCASREGSSAGRQVLVPTRLRLGGSSAAAVALAHLLSGPATLDRRATALKHVTMA